MRSWCTVVEGVEIRNSSPSSNAVLQLLAQASYELKLSLVFIASSRVSGVPVPPDNELSMPGENVPDGSAQVAACGLWLALELKVWYASLESTSSILPCWSERVQALVDRRRV